MGWAKYDEDITEIIMERDNSYHSVYVWKSDERDNSYITNGKDLSEKSNSFLQQTGARNHG